ncbi:MAG: DUF1640 domain-containing protein [Magnetococcales bacterium]|nr:DUF1640 domain-containing protein [Magnetococcales bacterium]
MSSLVIPFDTLAFVKKLETAGVPSPQAEAQAEALSDVLQKVEESRLQELATKGDVLAVKKEVELAKAELRKEIEAAKVDTIKWVIATGMIILGGVATINRFFPPLYHLPSAQELRLPAPPTTR